MCICLAACVVRVVCVSLSESSGLFVAPCLEASSTNRSVAVIINIKPDINACVFSQFRPAQAEQLDLGPDPEPEPQPEPQQPAAAAAQQQQHKPVPPEAKGLPKLERKPKEKAAAAAADK
jgi:hypothetical protein